MLATFALEICLAVYTLWRYRMTSVSRLVVALIGFLAVFQMAEYMVCGGLGVAANTWARIGYVAITVLPPIGIHLAYALAGRSSRVVVGGAYVLAIGFIGYFLFATDVFMGNQCMGNYVIFQLGPAVARAYTFYYYGLLLLSVGLSLQFAGGSRGKVRRSLWVFVTGYALFMLPTTIANTVDPATTAGIPSVMCGFAVLLALVTTFGVLPLVGRQRIVANHRRK
jgi:hypothetical protein